MGSWIRNNTERAEQPITREQGLWKAVLSQAVYEACTDWYQGTPLTATEKGRAKIWLNIFNPDFKQVCEWAGYEPEYIIYKAKQFLQKKDKINKEIELKRKNYAVARKASYASNVIEVIGEIS